MDLETFFRVTARRWQLVAALGVLGLVAGLGGAALAPTVYQSSTTLLLSAQSTDPDTPMSSTTTAATQAMPTVLGLARSDLVLDPAAHELGTTAAALRPRVTVENDTGTFIITISVTGSSPAAAHDATSAVAEELGQAIPTSLSPEVSTTHLATSTVSPASTPTSPVAPVRTLWAAGGLLLGLGAGAAAALLLWARDVRARHPGRAQGTHPAGSPRSAASPRSADSGRPPARTRWTASSPPVAPPPAPAPPSSATAVPAQAGRATRTALPAATATAAAAAAALEADQATRDALPQELLDELAGRSRPDGHGH